MKGYIADTLTLESGIDVGQGINVGPGRFDKKNKYTCSMYISSK